MYFIKKIYIIILNKINFAIFHFNCQLKSCLKFLRLIQWHMH
ncbi:MAG: VF530 family DNA-binding protein [Acetobacterium sp.]|nr:VF530 family DNA-binding protein [Acetobacterium sp.]